MHWHTIGPWKRPICRGVMVDLRHPDPHLFPTSRPHPDSRTITTLTFLSALSLHDQANQRQDIVDYFPPIVDRDLAMGRGRLKDKKLVIDVLSEVPIGCKAYLLPTVTTHRPNSDPSYRFRWFLVGLTPPATFLNISDSL
jgi:hypothetical protein